MDCGDISQFIEGVEKPLPFIMPEQTKPSQQLSYLRRFFIVDPLTNEPCILVNSKCRGLLSEWGYCSNPVTNKPAPYVYRLNEDQSITDEEPMKQNDHATQALFYMLYGIRNFRMGMPKSRVEKKKKRHLVRVGAQNYQW